MVVLFLAACAFDVFTGEKSGLLVQIDIFPFGLQQLGIAVFTRDAIQQPGLDQVLDGQRLHLRRFYLFGLYVSRGVYLCLGGFLV